MNKSPGTQSEVKRLRRWAWLPIPAFLIAMGVLWSVNEGQPHESVRLLLIMNFVFSVMASALVAYLLGRSFQARGALGLLVLGCGVIMWGSAGFVAVVAGVGGASRGIDVNLLITIHNVCVCLSALCQLMGVVLLQRPGQPVRSPDISLAIAYAAALAAVGLVVLAANAGWMPVFFVQGQGGTPLRDFVLGSAVLMFAFAAILLRVTSPAPLSAFAYWYALALGMIAVGLFGIMIESVHAGALSWTGRAAQFLSGVYMLMAAVASVRESGSWHVSIERLLRESEEKYRSLVENAPAAIYEMNPDGTRFLSVNRTMCSMLGYSRAELLAMSPAELLDAQSRSVFADRVRTKLSGGVLGESVEYRVRKKNGEWIYAIVSVSAITYTDEQPASIVVVAYDITARKQAEEELRKAQARVESDLAVMTQLRELSMLSTHETDLATILLRIVDAAIAVSGADFGNIQLLDAETGDLKIAAQRGFSEEWLDFWESVSRGRGSCGTALERGERITVEDVELSPVFVGTPTLEVQRKAGVRAVQSTPLLSRSGEPLGMFSTHYRSPHRPDDRALRLLDVLARQAADMIERARAEKALARSEERMRFAQRAARAGTWDWDLRSGEIIWSPELFALFGLDPERDHASFDRWNQLLHPHDREGAGRRIELALEQHGVLDSQYRIVRPDGETRWISALGEGAYDRENRPTRMSGICVDVTDRKRAEQELAAAKETLERQLYLLQRALIPPEPRLAEGYTAASAYVPAFAGQEIGGDFLDVFTTEDGHMAIVIGDVSGKGLEAAELAVTTRSTIGAFGYDLSSPKEALTHANSLLFARQAELEHFVTAFMAVVDPPTGHVLYAGAGHPQPIMRRASGDTELLSSDSVPLGIADDSRYSQADSRILPGDTLVLYTDGVSEAHSEDYELFGTARAMRVVKEDGAAEPGELVDKILHAVRDWTGGKLRDDLAVLVISRNK